MTGPDGAGLAERTTLSTLNYLGRRSQNGKVSLAVWSSLEDNQQFQLSLNLGLILTRHRLKLEESKSQELGLEQ